MKDMKEVFQQFYDESGDLCMNEHERNDYAARSTVDYFADLADDARDRAKEDRISPRRQP